MCVITQEKKRRRRRGRSSSRTSKTITTITTITAAAAAAHALNERMKGRERDRVSPDHTSASLKLSLSLLSLATGLTAEQLWELIRKRNNAATRAAAAAAEPETTTNNYNKQ